MKLDELAGLAEKATAGPWRLAVDERQYTPEYIAKHPDSRPPRAIYGVVTQWIHGQLKGPVSITYTSIPMPGIYADSSPRGSMDEKDAVYIAACDPGTILKLLPSLAPQLSGTDGGHFPAPRTSMYKIRRWWARKHPMGNLEELPSYRPEKFAWLAGRPINGGEIWMVWRLTIQCSNHTQCWPLLSLRPSPHNHPVRWDGEGEYMSSLGEEYPKQQARCREVLEQYIEIGTAGNFGAMMIRAKLKEADEAAVSGDVARMLRAFEAMKDVQ
jgi:hypothetical protein